MPNLPSKNQTKQTLNKRIECGVSFDWMAKKKHSQWVNIVKLHRRNNCWCCIRKSRERARARSIAYIATLVVRYNFFTQNGEQLLDMNVIFLARWDGRAARARARAKKAKRETNRSSTFGAAHVMEHEIILISNQKKANAKERKKESAAHTPSNTFSNLIFKSQQRQPQNGKKCSSRIIHYLARSPNLQ